ncbi:hypothetical protein B0H16DRAFT_1793316 [Mycena metata]|uniref:MYND-type domain-containing protein n=1 Tax=Mycena metata TaxID=1033252 RepID=A0AAD7NL05_9AGAR|nr:hypothetical protein B0H16DRAFT_1793316 [Mycena metata]
MQDLKALCMQMRNHSVSDSTALLFLPAFYQNLDPAGIPSFDDEDDKIALVACALASIEGLYFSEEFLPVAAVVDLWPRYWAWIEFFQFGSNVLRFISCFEHDDALADLVAATPGVRTLIAQTWSLLVRRGPSTDDDDILDSLETCITGSINAWEPAGLEEYVDGAGGALEDLASLVVSTINDFVLLRGPPLSEVLLSLVQGLLHFVLVTEAIPANKDITADYLPEDELPLCSALWACGFTSSLVRVMIRLAVTSASESLEDCFLLLRFAFNSNQGLTRVIEAAEAGVLQTMLVCGTLPPGHKVHLLMKVILTGILPMSLVYSTVVCALEDELEKASIAFELPSPLEETEGWKKFVALVRERSTLRKNFAGTELQGACDNMACGVISLRPTLKRCSGCQSAYYCSRECQIADWHRGKHRNICSDRRFGLSLNNQQDLIHFDRAFLRYLLQYDYETHRAPTIYPAQARFIAQHPNQPFYTLFDYSTGAPRITVQSASSMARFAGYEAEWHDFVTRSSASEGRMEIHVVELVEEGVPRFWVIPLRTNSSRIHAEIKRIAATIPHTVGEGDSAVLIQAVRTALDQEKDSFLAIH